MHTRQPRTGGKTKKHVKEKSKPKVVIIYLFLKLGGPPDVEIKKLAMDSFSSITSEFCNTGSIVFPGKCSINLS